MQALHLVYHLRISGTQKAEDTNNRAWLKIILAPFYNIIP
jgi:hypothetical protein